MSQKIEAKLKISRNSIKTITIIIILILIPLCGFLYKGIVYQKPQYEKTVWASLYTWYGVPGQPAGKYFYPEWQKNATNPEDIGFNYSLSTMQNIIQNNNPYQYNISGEATQINQTLVFYFNYNRVAYSRMYIEINISIVNLVNADVKLQIYQAKKIDGSMKYFICEENITDKINPAQSSSIVNQVMNVYLNSTSINSELYPGNIFAINLTAKAVGNYSLAINYLQASSWQHYNEDYHTISDEEGFWYNDPPVHLATAHHAYYNGSKWPEIPSYGIYNHSEWGEVPEEKAIQYGIYDSLNKTVIKAQLMLMEKAGIDVCQIMHPWGIDVAELIFDVAEEINSNLSFSFYIGGRLDIIADVMEKLADNPRFYKIDGKAVINFGSTGSLGEPYSIQLQRAREIKKLWDVYLVGDLYSSRYITKEEMLEIFDLWYYYDTSAAYRMGYGAPEIPNYQPNGELLPLNNWDDLDQWFGAIAELCHSHGKGYVATVIPGTDNTVVHDFIGSPLYDGRPGTINERMNGLTYNKTWQAAIAAGSDFINIVSWNELHEGTEIEPTLEDGTYYVELTKYWSDVFK
ncbi:MAG: hypothetical protein ACTSRZ_17265 [Promethearchaeota archaeon]